MIIRGHNPQGDVAETYEVKDGTYTYKSPVDHGSGKVAPNLAYVAFGGTFRFLHIPDRCDGAGNRRRIRSTCFRLGHGSIAPLTTLEVNNGKEKKTFTAYAIGHGLRTVALPGVDGR